jgi:uncharacterized protein (TIGR02145 family)
MGNNAQTWMAENLNYDTTGSYGSFGSYNCNNCAKYGRLYIWEVAKKVCPIGWHLPSNAEFEMLIDAVGGEDVAGKMLKSTSGWADNGNGLDKYGFSGLPAGCWHCDWLAYFNENQLAAFWSLTKYSDSDAYFMSLMYIADEAFVDDATEEMTSGLSVRCLKD